MSDQGQATVVKFRDILNKFEMLRAIQILDDEGDAGVARVQEEIIKPHANHPEVAKRGLLYISLSFYHAYLTAKLKRTDNRG